MRTFQKRREILRHAKNPMTILRSMMIQASYRLGRKKVPALPLVLNVEPNNYCNFKCPHCQVTYWDKEKTNLTENLFERLMGQFPSLVRVKLQGMGEPLLNKNLVPMVEMGEERGIGMNFNSNGSVMTEKVISRLLDLKRTTIKFSIDGATKEVFESMRVGGNFDKVIENIRNLLSQRKGAASPRIEVWAVVTQKNIDEVSEIVKLVKDMGVDVIHIQSILNSWGKDDMDELNSPERVAEAKLGSVLQDARETAEEIGMNINIHSRKPYSEEKQCPWPWKSAYIASNGDVVPCCILADADTVKMGNVFETDFKEIWNSEQYQELRQNLHENNIPSYCTDCYGHAADGDSE